MEEQLVAQLERIATALEELQRDGIIVYLDPDNISGVLEEVKTSTPKQ